MFVKLLDILIHLRTYLKLKHVFYGFTLNSIGPVYGLKRIEGETNRKYERRILKVACRRLPDVVDVIKAKEEREHQ